MIAVCQLKSTNEVTHGGQGNEIEERLMQGCSVEKAGDRGVLRENRGVIAHK